jgi:hypothetical protein
MGFLLLDRLNRCSQVSKLTHPNSRLPPRQMAATLQLMPPRGIRRPCLWRPIYAFCCEAYSREVLEKTRDFPSCRSRVHR